MSNNQNQPKVTTRSSVSNGNVTGPIVQPGDKNAKVVTVRRPKK